MASPNETTLQGRSIISTTHRRKKIGVNKTANFENNNNRSFELFRPKLNKWNTSAGDLQYSGHKKPKRAFRPKFSESLAKWKAPHFYDV